MPKFSVSVPHGSTKAEATEKVKVLLARIEAKYANLIKDLHQEFEGDKLVFSFKTMGVKVAGEGTVDEENVNIVGNLPIAAMMFKGKIESDLRTELTRMLGSNKTA